MDLGSKARRGGKKNRKIGRSMRRPARARYNAEHRWLKNKAYKLIRHIKRFPMDQIARKALVNLRAQKSV